MAKENSNIRLKLITIEEMENYINSSKHTNQEFIDNIKKNIDVFKEEKDSKIYALIANKQFKKEEHENADNRIERSKLAVDIWQFTQ